MRVGFVYDVKENVFVNQSELLTELFEPNEANQIIRALKENGHEVEVIDGAGFFARNIEALRRRIDFVFNEAKGLYGPDRKMIVPALCRIYGMPYIGSDAYAVTLARNKWHTTAVAQSMGIRVPETRLYRSLAELQKRPWRLFPAFAKPNYESSSIGVSDKSISFDLASLEEQVVELIDTYGQPVLVQTFIQGAELQVSLVGNDMTLQALGVQEMRACDEMGNYRPFIRNQDWTQAAIDFPCWSQRRTRKKAESMAKVVFNALGMYDYGRIDFRITDKGTIFFIEAATHPHLTEGSSFLAAASASSLSLSQLVALLVQTAVARYSGVTTNGF